MLRVFIDGWSDGDRIYHVGYHSLFRSWLSERFDNLVASQYEEGRKPGEIESGIGYEDLTQLSFPDDEFDCIVCMEILEHIPDYQAALREMARTLKPGGRALLSFPWLGGDHYGHLIRAEMLTDGSINHILPPEYHGDPAKGEGILSFRAFGWKILDELRHAGFTGASAKFVFGPLHGYMTLLDPVIVAIR
jgi:SAM-dependent methyltransferase